MTGPRERMKAVYITEERNPRLLQRAQSIRMLDHPVTPHIRRSSSTTYLPPHYRHQPNSFRISAAGSFDDDIVRADNLSRHYQPNNSRITLSRSFDDDVRADNNNFPYNPSFQKRHGLPPRPPQRYHSHQPNPRYNHSTAPMRPVYPKGVHSIQGLSPSSTRVQRRPSLQRKVSGYHRGSRRKLIEGDRSGRFPQVGDRPTQSRQQFRRSSSLPMVSPETKDSSSSRPRLSRKNSAMPRYGPPHHLSVEKSSENARVDDSIANDNKQFSPQKSTSIYRRFGDKKKVNPELDGDIWIERIILNGASGRKKTYFKSVYGNIVRNEPPTGASSIVYLEDIIDDRQAKSPKQKPLQQQQQEHQEILRSKLSSKETDEESSVETKKDNNEKKQTQPKRRASFFGFMMKKNRKNKIEESNAN